MNQHSVLAVTAALAITCLAPAAWAVPGPDSLVVVANRNLPGSVALAERYRAARAVPPSQVCALDLPNEDTIPLTIFRTEVKDALARCLGDRLPQIEGAVLIRGVPLRVALGPPGAGVRVSLAAALALHETTTSSNTPVLGSPPGQPVNCGGGNTCLGARVPNGFLRQGVFEAGWSRSFRGFEQRLWLVTMLHGRSDEDAARLIASATTAEALGGAVGVHLLMAGADPARGVRDADYTLVENELRALGQTVERVPFDANLTGRSVASFFTGTAGLGATIEGNRFLPGSLVDNLTSFGAVPPNFLDPSQEVQVSIARWVSQGVAGVHGTTDEPLNNVFPNRRLIVDYVEGGTLAEVYFRYLPFLYWHNLVLGDPLAAPYARRPQVVVSGVFAGERVEGDRRITVTATDPLGRPLRSLRLFVDGRLVAESTAASLEHCLAARGPTHLLAVAQVADDGTLATRHQPKGWSGFGVELEPGPVGCGADPDAGLAFDGAANDLGPADGGPGADAAAWDGAVADLGPMTDAAGPEVAEEESGCGCQSSGARQNGASGLLGWLLLLAFSRGRSRGPRSPGDRWRSATDR